MRPEDVPVHLVVLAAMAMAGVTEDDMTAEQFVATERGRGWCGSARHALAAVLPLAVAQEREACAAATGLAAADYWRREVMRLQRLVGPVTVCMKADDILHVIGTWRLPPDEMEAVLERVKAAATGEPR